MKKLICLLLALAMTLSLAACGSKADDKTPEEDNPAQAETPIDDKQDEPAADDTDKDEKSGTVVIEPDANKDEKSDEAQKPAEPTKSDSKKDETPASKPSEPTKPAETPSETPAETPTAQDTGALSLLTSVWSTHTARMINSPPRAATQAMSRPSPPTSAAPCRASSGCAASLTSS